MMISPYSYVKSMEGISYRNLISKRDSLIREIRKLEKVALKRDLTDEAWQICPGPDVRYQVYLEYLSELCSYMHEKYNSEYVWRDETVDT